MFEIDNPFTMVVLIVAIVMGAKVLQARMHHEGREGRGRSARRSSEDDALIASLSAQVERLNERIGVLEKLATDDDRRLAREIDSLNPTRRRDAQP